MSNKDTETYNCIVEQCCICNTFVQVPDFVLDENMKNYTLLCRECQDEEVERIWNNVFPD